MKSATGEECKTKTSQRIKMQHQTERYIKRVQHEKRYNVKRLLKKSATWKWRSKRKVQHEKNATRKKINCHSEIRKNAQE